MHDDYVTVRVPESLRTLFAKTNKELELGYTSFAEFVKESIRRRVEEIRLAYQKDS